jgi:hypothetical protein
MAATATAVTSTAVKSATTVRTTAVKSATTVRTATVKSATTVRTATVKSATTVSATAAEPARVAIVVVSAAPSSATVEEAEPRIWIDECGFTVEIRQRSAAIALKVVEAVGTDILRVRRLQACEGSKDHADGT